MSIGSGRVARNSRAQAFDELRRAGKEAHFGVSNFTPAQFELLASRTTLVTNQVELHPLHLAPLTDGTLDQAQRLRLRPMIWSPLAGGALLTGQGDAARRVQAILHELGRRHGVSAASIAFAWLLRHPSRPIPVTGSHRIDALHEALAARSVSLSAQDWTEVWQAATGQEVA
jgi:predicted oxidoreductase